MPCGRVCAETACGSAPRSGSHFCGAHQAMEQRCRIFIRTTHLRWRNPGTVRELDDTSAIPANPHSDEGEGGQWCQNAVAPGQEVCDDPYCKTVYKRYGKGPPHPIGRNYGESAQEFRRRNAAWHAEHAVHRFEQPYLQGFFVFICACGANACLCFAAAACSLQESCAVTAVSHLITRAWLECVLQTALTNQQYRSSDLQV